MPFFLSALITCLLELKAAGVTATPVARAGLAKHPVAVTSPIAGVRYVLAGAEEAPLTIDCALASALVEIGPMLRGLGIQELEYVSATSVRYVRRTHRLSGHSFGLAIDVRAVRGPRGLTYVVAQDFERGTGDPEECIGDPQTAAGRLLKTLMCRLKETGRFRSVLSPDFDADHWDHFHIEVRR